MMERLFATHMVRKRTELDGIWIFQIAKETEERRVTVPSCLETYPGLENYKGAYTYSREVIAKGNVHLICKGVSHTADIYWDGEKIGHHYNAYTPFELIIPQTVSGTHCLRIEGDNSFHKESALHISNDYFTYGGINRPVILEEVPDIYLKRLHCITSKQGDIWTAGLRIQLHNIGTAACRKLKVRLDERIILEKAIEAEEGETWISEDVPIHHIIPYELDRPKLYTLTAELWNEDACEDDLIERVGFRTISVKGKDIYFNEKKLLIKGFNRHEDHGLFGCAIPVEAMDYDLRLFKDMGANAVRTSHYPNDERFLDLCDEYGILVWEESHARGLNETQMRHPDFLSQSLDCIDEMILNHINHPSIYTWGLLNECASNTEYGREIYRRLIGRIRSLDISRPVTFATCMIKSDICLDLPDLISLNIYPLWYFDADPNAYLQEVYDWVQETEGRGKPFLISEIGAGAIPRYYTHNDLRWSENRQAEILERQLDAVLQFKDAYGVFIWQFCDCRVPDEGFYGRPRCMNNKGVVDEYRQRKLAYEVVKKAFHKYVNQ